MGILSPEEINQLNRNSRIAQKYNTAVDERSAYEILNEKLEAAGEEEPIKPTGQRPSSKKEESWTDHPVVRQAGRTAASIITRSLLGVLGLGTTRRRRRY
jgi:hypothetical protein